MMINILSKFEADQVKKWPLKYDSEITNTNLSFTESIHETAM